MMKTIGLIGGITYVSTLEYYRLLNELSNKELGGASTVKLLLYSVDFGEIKKLTEADDWNVIITIVTAIAQKLEAAGADVLILGANTMHKIADRVQASLNIPLIHVATETAKTVKSSGLKKVALLGTKYTMQQDFYKDKLKEEGLEILVPNADEIEFIQASIYQELGKNIFRDATRERYLSIMQRLAEEGAEGFILGCTEIPLLIKQEHTELPVFDTTFLHAQAAVNFALSK